MKVERERRMIRVKLERNITIDNIQALKSNLFSILNKTAEKIILNFINVDRIDCAGMRVLLTLLQELEKAEIQLELVNLQSSYVREFFRLSGLKEKLTKREQVKLKF